MFSLKVLPDNVGLPLVAPEEASGVGDQFLSVLCSPPAHSVTLDILIQQLVRVQLRAIAWKVGKTNLAGMLFNPVSYLYGMMDRVTINDEEYLALNLA